MGRAGVGAVGYRSLGLVVCCEHFVASNEDLSGFLRMHGLVHWKVHRG